MLDLGEAFLFLAILLVWNAVGRHLQVIEVEREVGGMSSGLGAILHVIALSSVLFLLLAFLISGAIGNPTDFRYAGF